MERKRVLSVSELTGHIKTILEQDRLLGCGSEGKSQGTHSTGSQGTPISVSRTKERSSVV